MVQSDVLVKQCGLQTWPALGSCPRLSLTNKLGLAICFSYLTLSFLLCKLGLVGPTLPDLLQKLETMYENSHQSAWYN